MSSESANRRIGGTVYFLGGALFRCFVDLFQNII